MPLRISKKAPKDVRDWSRFIRNAADSKYITLLKGDDDTLVRLAGVLTCVGSIDDADARRLFWAFSILFMHRSRKNRWLKAVESLPADRDTLLRIPECCEVYAKKSQELSGSIVLEPLDKAPIKLDIVLDVMLRTPNPTLLINHAISKKRRFPSFIFSQQTLDEVSKKQRGAFAEDATQFRQELESSGIKAVEI